MNDNLPVASFDAFISSLGKRAKDINKLETNEVSKLFAGTINLLAKPMYQIQEFLPFPQNISAADPGEICLLAEDELDPYQDYMVSFKQGETEIDSIGDMISKQSITLPIPNGLKPGEVEIRIYPVKYGRRLSELVGKSVIFLEESELDKTTIETFLFKKFKRPLDELINNTLCSLLCENQDRSFQNYCEQKHLQESLATIKCFNSINRSSYENKEPPRKRLKEVFKSQSIETQTELNMSSTECQTEPVNLTRESHEAIKSEPKAEVQVDQAPEEKQKNSKLEERIKEQERKRKIEQSVKSIKNGTDSTPPKSVARKVLAPSIDAKPCQPRALLVKPVEIKPNVIEDSKKNDEQKIDLLNPKFDLQIIADEDERWQKRQDRKNVPVIAVRSSSGKVKKGSGFRYDKKRGYDRYFSSSEEETASEEEEDELINQNGVDDGCEDLFIPQYTANSHSIYSF